VKSAWTANAVATPSFMNFLLLIGIAVVLAALVSAGFWARSRLRRSSEATFL